MFNQLNVESVGVYRRVGRVSINSEGLEVWTALDKHVLEPVVVRHWLIEGRGHR